MKAKCWGLLVNEAVKHLYDKLESDPEGSHALSVLLLELDTLSSRTKVLFEALGRAEPSKAPELTVDEEYWRKTLHAEPTFIDAIKTRRELAGETLKAAKNFVQALFTPDWPMHWRTAT